MKRNQTLSLLLALVLSLSLLAGCGAKSGAQPGGTDSCTQSNSAEADFGAAAGEPEASSPGTDSQTPDGPFQSAKLIYRGTLNMETTAFDQVMADLQKLVQECGGYMENSSVYNSGSSYRSADCTVRIPVEHYNSFFQKAGNLCHVVHRSEEKENVTQYYYDVDGRLKTQQSKLDRLQALLAQAETMEDLITIESAISDTEHEIESLSGELKHYDDLVNFATVNLSIQEVYKLSNTEEPVDSFGGRMTQALSDGWRSFLNALENCLVFLAYHWAGLLLLAGAVVLIVCLMRRQYGKEKKLFSTKKHKDSSDQPPV